MSEKEVTYTSYLHIEGLLDQQKPASEEHDEMLFIIIHQVYELWFKQMLHETDHMMALLNDNNGIQTAKTCKRILTIMKTIVGQLDILETMTPLEFGSFRDRLAASSGFQSHQFREFEFILGYKRPEFLNNFPESSIGYMALKKRLNSPSLWDVFLQFLSRQGVAIPDSELNRDLSQKVTPNEEIQKELVKIYIERPELASVCELLLDLDEGLQEWRYRHVKMVQRTIGMKMGTGGSSGVNYLKSTIIELFPDLWAIRSQF